MSQIKFKNHDDAPRKHKYCVLCLFHGKIVALKSHNSHRISDSTKLNSLQALLGVFYCCKSNKFSITEKQICVLGPTTHLNKLSSFHEYASHTL